MKRLLVLFIVFAAISCSQQKAKLYQLPGNFKYVSFYWNNTKDSLGMKLLHYLSIDKDGSYEMIVRKQSDSAGYYYGILDTTTISLLKKFITDTTFSNAYLENITYDKPIYMFDYKVDTMRKKITFIPSAIPDVFKNIQAKLDSFIRMPVKNPWKRGYSPFNIDKYLRRIINEDTTEHLFLSPVK